MILILKHLLLSSACLWAYWLLYRFALRNDTFFGRNRVFLLASAALALLAPLVALGVEQLSILLAPDESVVGPDVLLLPLQVVGSSATESAFPITWPVVVFGVWAIGAGWGLLRLAIGLWRTAQLVVAAPPAALSPALTLRAYRSGARPVAQRDLPTFSFFHYLAWNEIPGQSEVAQRQILAHELAHIRGHHTWDVLGTEILRAVLWFNPAAHWYAAALKAQHEFLADAEAVETCAAVDGARPESYIQLMVRTALQQYSIPLVHSFNDSPIKTRIAMLQKNRTAFWKGNLKTILALSVATVAALAIGCTNSLDRLTRERNQNEANRKELAVSFAKELEQIGTKYGIKSDGIGFEVKEKGGKLTVVMLPQEAAKVTDAKDLARMEFLLNQMAEQSNFDLAKIKQQNDHANRPQEGDVLTVVDEGAMPVGGYELFYKYIMTSLQYPSAARQAGTEGKVYVEFIIQTDGTLGDFKVLKGIGQGCDEEALRVMAGAAQWVPGRQAGNAVKQRIVMPISFKLGNSQPNSISIGEDKAASPAVNPTNEVFTVAEERALPVGGYEQFYKYLAANMQYPKAAREAKVQGKVYVEFIVQTNGTLTDFKVRKGIGQGCDEEALRVMAGSAKWVPGRQAGNAVKQQIVMPISFKLN